MHLFCYESRGSFRSAHNKKKTNILLLFSKQFSTVHKQNNDADINPYIGIAFEFCAHKISVIRHDKAMKWSGPTKK